MFKTDAALHVFDEAAKLADKAFFAFDVDGGKFIYLNPAFEKLFQISKEDIASEPENLLEAVDPEDRNFISEQYRELVDGAAKKQAEIRVRSGRGIKWVTATAFLIEEKQQGKKIAGYAEDITATKDKENNLQKFAAKKDSIMEILSHDLAGSLANIKGIASLLAKELKGEGRPKLDEMVNVIEKTSERGIRLIREFVKQEFLQSENSALVKHRVDMVEKVKEVVEQYKSSADQIQKVFNLNLPREPVYIKIDTYKFTQVLNNLISNSIKFTDDNGEIDVSVENNRNSTLITVADNGVGIPEKYHASLFDKFTKARRPGLRGEPSVGLGMSIIKTIVEWHKGEIWFKSKENKGTVFYIKLPKE